MKRICLGVLGLIFISCEETGPADLAKGNYVGYYYVTPSGFNQSTENGLGATRIVKVNDYTIDCIMDIPGIPDTISNVQIKGSGYDGFTFQAITEVDTFGGAKNNDIYWRYHNADTSISFWGAKL